MALKDSGVVRVEAIHVQDAAPGLPVFIQVETVVAGIEEAGCIEQPGPFAEVRLQPKGNVVVHDLQASVVGASFGGQQRGVLEAAVGAHGEVGLVGVGKLQRPAERSVGQQLGEDHTAGHEGHSEQHPQE